MPYKTKQKERIDALIESLGEKHFTADDAEKALKERNEAVGKATIYRYLERLVLDGRLKKFMSADGKSACYQYIGGESCNEHFHLKCIDCGKIIHLECEHLDALAEHLAKEHGFFVETSRTIFCGRCSECVKKRADRKG